MDDSTKVEATRVDATGAGTTGPAAAELLAVVADPVRWRLLRHLADGRTACVCELQPIAAVAGNLLSYHLRVLREAGLVTAAKRGRWVDYMIATDALDRLHAAVPSPGPGAAVPSPRPDEVVAGGRAAAACPVPAPAGRS